MNIRLNIPECFLKEEKKCGYTVSADMKKVWAVALDMLNEFDNVCRKNGLRYFIAYGTLLGAIRHKGFIPWDDDVDLVMPRDDFEQLCAVAKENFRQPYFFQTEQTDPGFSRPFARLRNSDTTAFQRIEDYKTIPYNQGIFIDIFPLDNYPNAELDQIRFKKQLLKARKRMRQFSRFTTRFKKKDAQNLPDIFKNVIKSCISQLTRPILRVFRFGNPFVVPYIKVEQCFRNIETNACCVPYFFDNKRQIIWEKRWFDQAILVDFEMLKVPAPVGYEEILDVCYGNWREPVMMNTIHGEVFYDAEHSFRDYLSALRMPDF